MRLASRSFFLFAGLLDAAVAAAAAAFRIGGKKKERKDTYTIFFIITSIIGRAGFSSAC